MFPSASPKGATPSVLDRDASSPRVDASMLRQVGPAMVVIVLCIVATYLVPALQMARPWVPGDPVPGWNLLGRPFEGTAAVAREERVAEVDALATEVLAADEPAPPPAPAKRPVVDLAPGDALPAYVPQPDDDKAPVQSIELFAGDELDAFLSSLARTDAGVAGHITRIVHWGDSSIGMDGIPSAIRRRMQNRFGDAGHGFHLMAPPNASYLHREVRFRHNEAWDFCFIIQRCKKDGHYGLGGVTFSSTGGAESSFAPHARNSAGKVSKFEVWYAAQPHGGKLRVRVDKGEPQLIDTRADALEDRFHAIEVEEGAHRLSVRAMGRVRVYGVTLEREGPGVQWDGLELVGSFTSRLRAFDDEHLRAQLEHRAPDLVVLSFGGNDMIRDIPMSQYADEYRQVIQHLRRARPQMSCLIVAPLDHGVRKGPRIESLPVVAPMVEAQREAAKSEGCAFFDTVAAMGGEGSAGRWFRHDPRLMSGDLGHATASGHQVIGEALHRAIVEAYVAYRLRTDSK